MIKCFLCNINNNVDFFKPNFCKNIVFIMNFPFILSQIIISMMNLLSVILMSFSLLVQRKVRKEKTPGEKPFSSFTSCFSGTPVLRSNTAKDEAELTCLQHA